MDPHFFMSGKDSDPDPGEGSEEQRTVKETKKLILRFSKKYKPSVKDGRLPFEPG
jgi:hypothetical protein